MILSRHVKLTSIGVASLLAGAVRHRKAHVARSVLKRVQQKINYHRWVRAGKPYPGWKISR